MAFATTAVSGVLSVFCFAICKSAGNRKMWKWGKGFLPIRCKQQTLLPVAVKISGTTWMCFFVSKNKANGRSDVKRKFAEKRTHGKCVCKYRSKRCFERFLLCGWCKAVTLPHVSQTKNVIFQILRKNFKKNGKNYLKSVDKQLKGGIMLAVEDVEC